MRSINKHAWLWLVSGQPPSRFSPLYFSSRGVNDISAFASAVVLAASNDSLLHRSADVNEESLYRVDELSVSFSRRWRYEFRLLIHFNELTCQIVSAVILISHQLLAGQTNAYNWYHLFEFQPISRSLTAEQRGVN